jgi:hypothetical protein
VSAEGVVVEWWDGDMHHQRQIVADEGGAVAALHRAGQGGVPVLVDFIVPDGACLTVGSARVAASNYACHASR